MNFAEEFLHGELTDKIIAAAYDVHEILGSGFLEKVYENSLAIRLRKLGYQVHQQYPMNVYFEGVIVGEYFADLFVDDKVIVELKLTTELTRVHHLQLYNYLRATGVKVGLLLGFGERVVVRRRDLP